MLLSDLREVKTMLEIPEGDTSEDRKLLLLIEQCSSWIESYTNRDFFYKYRTQYYRGTNSQKILLRNRPVYADPSVPVQTPSLPNTVPQVFVDSGANYGQAPGAFTGSGAQLTYGTDFCLQIDQDDGISSRSAILLRVNDYWSRPAVRSAGLLSPYFGPDLGSIKVSYWAGYQIDNLPSLVRAAMNLLVSRLRWVIPTGHELSGEGYEDRSVSLITSEKLHLMAIAGPMISAGFRNWNF